MVLKACRCGGVVRAFSLKMSSEYVVHCDKCGKHLLYENQRIAIDEWNAVGRNNG
jgi:hypothetical protein